MISTLRERFKLEEEQQECSNKKLVKCARQSKQLLYLISKQPDGDRLKKAAVEEADATNWDEKQVRLWNHRDRVEELNIRKLPKISAKHDIPVLRSRELKAEVKRLLLKWYIGRFPIPQRGKPSPKHLTGELKKLAQKEEKVTEEEARLNWLV